MIMKIKCDQSTTIRYHHMLKFKITRCFMQMYKDQTIIIITKSLNSMTMPVSDNDNNY